MLLGNHRNRVDRYCEMSNNMHRHRLPPENPKGTKGILAMSRYAEASKRQRDPPIDYMVGDSV